MLQDPNVERYVSERLEPLVEQIKELQAAMFKLMQAKNLHLQNVSNRRELLFAFLKANENVTIPDYDSNKHLMIDAFLGKQ